MKILGKNIWRAVACIFCFVLLGQLEAQAQCACDTTAPFVSITPPEEVTSVISLSGEVFDEVGVVGMKWERTLTPGGQVVGEGTTNAYTSWDNPYLSWDAQGIDLSDGTNYITVIAWDAAGNEGTAELEVDYGQEQTPGSTTIIPNDKLKTKITLYAKYTAYDFVSVVAYLPKTPEEVFPLPFDQDLTVSVWVNNPDPNAAPEEKELQLFEETVPAYTVPAGSSRYRYSSSGPNLRDMQFSRNTATSTYMYLYAAKGNYLSNLKPPFKTVQQFIDFVDDITTYKVVIKIGNQTWVGVGNPTYADVSPNSHVTLRHNR